jgi:murein L,D-transpeptidase YcbB/YkuD
VRKSLFRFALSTVLAISSGAASAQTEPRWNEADAHALLTLIAGSAAEGLQPAEYGEAAIRAALENSGLGLDALADKAALTLAHDYFEGRAGPQNRSDWHIPRGRIDYGPWLDAVLKAHSVRTSFAGLLPTSPAYRALKAGFAECRAANANCGTIAANLERWRWLPRSFGSRYLWVNIPAYRLDLVENGAIVSSHKIIVGKPGTRTPVFRAAVTGVTINPWWNVPCSIVDESIGKLVREHPAEAARRGFVSSVDAKGKLQVRQKPGPDNALGQIKLEMPNQYGVYIHDTPAKDLFGKDSRAFSHGCIRTEAPADLARAVLGQERSWEINTLLIIGTSRTLKLAQTMPVYVVYLTAEPDRAQPGRIATYRDIYRQDARLIPSR